MPAPSLTEMKSALKQKSDKLTSISNAWDVDDDGNVTVTTEQKTAWDTTLAEAKDLQDLIRGVEDKDALSSFLDGAPGSPAAARAAAGLIDDDGRTPRTAEGKSLGQRWLESPAWKSMKENGFHQIGGTMSVEVGVPALAKLSVKDVYTAMAGTATISGLGSIERDPLTPRQLRPGRVRDLFPSRATNATMIYGVRETGFTNAARVVPQRETTDGVQVFGLKPKSNLTLVTVTYPIATIAHLIDVHRNTLADEPQMQDLLDSEMIDGIKMAEDYEILFGDGVGDNLTGIVNTPGVQTYAQVDGDPNSATIRRAATRCMLAYYQPTGVILHPLDWEALELERDNNGAYRIATSVAVGGVKQVWRMNVVDTPAVTEGTYILGAFGQGAKLFDREMVSVTASSENRDNYERNVVTLRAEERVGLKVDRPESFVVGTLSA